METNKPGVYILSALLVVVFILIFAKSDLMKKNTTVSESDVQPTATTATSPRLQWSQPPALTIDKSKKYFATMKTNLGDIKFELYADKTPITVNNFVFLTNENFFDGLIFHRIIKDFMIQGGDPNGNGTGDPGYKFDDEFVEGLSNVRGTIAMANSGPNTNGSQFFINLVDNTYLDFDKEPLTSQHVVFGKVVEGMDVVDKIGNAKVGQGDKPLEDIVIDDVIITN